MTETETLAAIEAIKVLKARYFRGIDTKDWELMRQVLAPDVVCDYRGATQDPATGYNPAAATEKIIEGAEPAIEMMRTGLARVTSVHHGMMPEIEVTGADSARGVWPMVDRLLYPPGGPLRELIGYGHYHETYRRTADGWRIATIRLTRLRLDFLRSEPQTA